MYIRHCTLSGYGKALNYFILKAIWYICQITSWHCSSSLFLIDVFRCLHSVNIERIFNIKSSTRYWPYLPDTCDLIMSKYCITRQSYLKSILWSSHCLMRNVTWYNMLVWPGYGVPTNNPWNGCIQTEHV